MRLILGVMAWLVSGLVYAQISCTDLDGANVFSSEGAPVYLGFLGTPLASDSINNEFGEFGSGFSQSSVRNQFGQYGSATSPLSAQNQVAINPPKLVKEGRFLGYLSNNELLDQPSFSLAELDSGCQFNASSPVAFFGTAIPGSEHSSEATYSGLWFNPEQAGHGLSITVHSPEHVTIYWYTFDPFGFPIWIYAGGAFEGSRILGNALYLEGMVFGDWSVEDREIMDWGSIEVEFFDCDTAMMKWDSTLQYSGGEAFGSGEIPLTRLASTEGLEC